MITPENILSVIPQRPPFVMVDQLVGCDQTGSRSMLSISAENVLVCDGWFCEAGLIENIAQTAAAGAGYLARSNGLPPPVGYLGAVKNLEITCLPRIGDRIMTEVTIINQIFDITVVAGRVERDGQLLAKCEMSIFIKN